MTNLQEYHTASVRIPFSIDLDTGMDKLFQVQVTIHRGGQQMDPYRVDQINDYLAKGSLLPTDNAWHERLPDWVPVTQISSGLNAGDRVSLD
jgi:hypothetical protein